MLGVSEHLAVRRRSREIRNASARERRRAPAQVIRVQDGEQVLLIAVSRSHAGVGYLLRPDADGRLTCSCEGFRRRWDCSHVQAAAG